MFKKLEQKKKKKKCLKKKKKKKKDPLLLFYFHISVHIMFICFHIKIIHYFNN